MADNDKNLDTDVSESGSRDRRDEKDKSSKGKGQSKAKDLSHVPCKFFKVGSCTAGPSCPFSHNANEPGQQKDVCAWYVKGNCKFGHKCALAHLLPGQNMSMDRRNKKAAQLAAAAGQANGHKDREGGKSDRGKNQKISGGAGTSSRASLGPNRSSSLLSGSTAPTRVLTASSRPPLPISKAVPAPATPAPALKDADFASFDFSKAGEEVSKTVAAGAAPSEPASMEASTAEEKKPVKSSDNVASQESQSPTKSPFLPQSTPSQSRRFTGHHGSSPVVDFGPVGSPPRSSPSNPTRVNGFSPGVSPRESGQAAPVLMSTSPFSAPGGQSLFMPYEQGCMSDDFKPKSGLAASLGATRTLNMHNLSPPSQRSVSGPQAFAAASDALEDDDMEEFIPSSLTDLLTPGERSRRMSRTSSTNPATGVLGTPITSPTAQDHHHRYSRSVPATSLLHDIKSIWAEPMNTDHMAHRTPPLGATPGAGHGLSSLGAPSSFKSHSGIFTGFAEEGPSPSLLSPTNASAAFLPGLHQHYLSRPSINNLRNTSQPPYPIHHPQHPPMETKGSLMSSSPLISPLHANNHQPNDPFTMPQSVHGQHPSARPIPSNNGAFLAPELPLSPSARALQAHAPGQSLPQGLAAGYSRIHAQPPPPNVPSPAMSGTAFSPGTIGNLGLGQSAVGPEWYTGSPSKNMMQAPDANIGPHAMNNSESTGEADVGGLSSMFSRLSYSAAAARGGAPSPAAAYVAPPSGSPNSTVPVSMGRRPSGRGWSSHPLSSPLSGPVLTNDDDDLFSMDVEK